ncbi:hypothetical protein Mkiyose1665_39660 [Mycobacterium kiyosense]|nr:hypothetical protein IWGMT90018_27120 [Mycobacterium kiyosense]BDE14462.1 hypothetical protein MKCMC460_33220 [Mycobacterium sp. 20KCMC460]GLC02164.1 hypothetical protein SRL2020400_27550 [Mycobacterium kiyosense]GLC10579.1 hypothetical protein SRL2020411_52250 [Mycobacterium kiyosense]GLC15293.1 hypothetical protein SRL2020448_38960 [Mycobacterium kiyosense]
MGAWLRPIPQYHPPAPPTYTSQQIADAKAKVCAAYGKADHAVMANTGRNGDDDPATQLGLAANARIALFDSGQYLLKILGQEPATPHDLAEETRTLADHYQQLALQYMSEANDPELTSTRKEVDRSASRLSEMCK